MTVSDERLAELLFWFEDGNSPLSRDDDQAIVAALQDLTARRAAERAPRTPLREAAEQAYAKLVDAPTVGNDEYNRLSETCQSALDALAEAEGILQAALAAPASAAITAGLCALGQVLLRELRGGVPEGWRTSREWRKSWEKDGWRCSSAILERNEHCYELFRNYPPHNIHPDDKPETYPTLAEAFSAAARERGA